MLTFLLLQTNILPETLSIFQLSVNMSMKLKIFALIKVERITKYKSNYMT